MPFSFQRKYRRAGALAGLSLLLLAACAPGHTPVSFPPAETGSHTHPSVDAQKKLLNEARRAHLEERYRTAALLLKRFVTSYPESPRLAEARWWLARSYESAGDLQAAVGEYQTLAAAEPVSAMQRGSFQSLARRRLDELRSSGERVFPQGGRVLLAITRSRLPAGNAFGLWLKGLAEAGITGLVIDVGGTVPRQDAAAGRDAEDLFAAVVPIAHEQGLAVLAAVDLHRPTWLTLKEEWGGKVWDAAQGILRDTGGPDVSHPDYHAYVEDAIGNWGRTGIDGLLFRSRGAAGFADEFSTASLGSFQAAFGISLDTPGSFPYAPHPDTARLAADQLPPPYWRWAGWKTRHYLRLIERIAARFRQKQPAGIVAVEVHQEAVTSPVIAMTAYGEDLHDARHRQVDLVMPANNGAEAAVASVGLHGAAQSTEYHEGQWWAAVSISPEELKALPGSLAVRISAARDRGASHIVLNLTSSSMVP